MPTQDKYNIQGNTWQGHQLPSQPLQHAMSVGPKCQPSFITLLQSSYYWQPMFQTRTISKFFGLSPVSLRQRLWRYPFRIKCRPYTHLQCHRSEGLCLPRCHHVGSIGWCKQVLTCMWPATPTYPIHLRPQEHQALKVWFGEGRAEVVLREKWKYNRSTIIVREGIHLLKPRLQPFFT